MNSHPAVRGSREAGFTQPRDHSFSRYIPIHLAKLAGYFGQFDQILLNSTLAKSVEKFKMIHQTKLGYFPSMLRSCAYRCGVKKRVTDSTESIEEMHLATIDGNDGE